MDKYCVGYTITCIAGFLFPLRLRGKFVRVQLVGVLWSTLGGRGTAWLEVTSGRAALNSRSSQA